MQWLNVASRLSEMAAYIPGNVAVAEKIPGHENRSSVEKAVGYHSYTFQDLDEDSDRIARALIDRGVEPGMRLALMVRMGYDFVSLVYGLYKAGAVVVLIDPGMGMRRMLNCLAEVELDGFVAIPPVHAVRLLLRHRFPKAKHHLTVGPRWFWGGLSLSRIRRQPHPGTTIVRTAPDDPAAIIFTSGSTGPPKGVWYTHRNFDHQVEQIAERFEIEPGGIDLAGFPFFALFNAAMGTTTVIPEMDPTRPAKVDPEKILDAVRRWEPNQSFASPAFWNRVSRHCMKTNMKMPSLRRVISAGAPVPYDVLKRLKECLDPQAEIHTPYGATEALPIAAITASEVLQETAEKTRRGAGVCVGKRFSEIEWKVIATEHGPIARMEDAEELPVGQIGEIVVRGPQVTTRYITRQEANALAKVTDDASGEIWHRMGDVGYLDEEDRFWFCGRKAHRLETESGTMYTIPCEAIFNCHEKVFRTALVGTGPWGSQRPVLVVEPHAEHFPSTIEEAETLIEELRDLGRPNALTESIKRFLFHRDFPVDVRHNTKIFREKLTEWVESHFKNGTDSPFLK